MALPPNIPTSFVPHTSRKHGQLLSSLAAAMSVLAYILLAIAFALAIGVFVYGRILSATASSKDTELTKAEQAVNAATAQDFLRLRDRLSSSKTLLGRHVAFSRFFSALQTLLPSDVRFVKMHVSVGEDSSVTVQGSGVAKNFNALAAASQSFATNGKIKDVIFSKMEIRNDNSVSFGFSATLDPSLISYVPSTTPVVPASSAATASTTAATSTSGL